jgi:hypothetical protein
MPALGKDDSSPSTSWPATVPAIGSGTVLQRMAGTGPAMTMGRDLRDPV